MSSYQPLNGAFTDALAKIKADNMPEKIGPFETEHVIAAATIGSLILTTFIVAKRLKSKKKTHK